MKRTLTIGAMLGALILSLVFTACQKEPDNLPGQKKESIVILFENDVHCAIDGYAAMAGLRDAIGDTAWVAMVSSGDFLQGGTAGAISDGSYIVDIMRAMRYDAVELGNHEFDYGVPRMQQLLAGMDAPVLCANLYDMHGNRLYAPYTIRSYGGHKVAFVGVLTAATMEDEAYSFYADGQQFYDLRPAQMTQLVQQSVDDARAAGAEYVVLLSHLGEYEVSLGVNSHQMVAATTGIDVVLDGHTHSVILCDTIHNASGQPVYITQTGTQFANVGKLVISSDGEMHISHVPTSEIPYRNALVARTVDSIQTLVGGITGSVVFHSDYRLAISDENGVRQVRKAETNAGNMVADAMRYVMDADLGFCNGGGIRANIEAGDVTYAQVIDMLPFDNRIVKIQATGAQVTEMLRLCTQNLPAEDGEFPQVSGLRFSVHVVDGGGNSISSVEVLQADGTYAPINPTAIYTIGTSDYCAYRGGLHNAFAGCTVLEESFIRYRDLLVPYVTEVYGGNVPPQYATAQGRITID